MKIIWEGRNLWHAATTHGLYRGSGCTAWQMKTSKDADCSKEGEQSCRMKVLIFCSWDSGTVSYNGCCCSFYVMSGFTYSLSLKEVRSSGGLLLKRTLCYSPVLPWLLYPTGHLCPCPPRHPQEQSRSQIRDMSLQKALRPFTGFVTSECCNVQEFRVAQLKWLINYRKMDRKIDWDG